jgi:glycosyltransferase involved in cell wall biosynthesis
MKYLPSMGWLPSMLTIDDKREYEFDRRQGSQSLLLDISPEVPIYRTKAGEPSLDYLYKEKDFGQGNFVAAALVKIFGRARRWVFRNLLLPDRYITWLPFALIKGRQVVKRDKIDVIFATCPPNSTALVGALLKHLAGRPLVLDFRDDWIDTPWHFSLPMITRRINQKLERWVVKTADKVVLVTEWSRNAFLKRYPKEPANKFVLIPNGVDLAEVTALKSAKPTVSSSKFTIVHAGSLNDSKSWTRSLAPLFQAVRDILEQRPELAEKMTLVFAGDFPEGHRQLAEKMSLSGVVKAVGHLAHEEVLRLTQSADLLLAINYESFATLIPAKIYEYWALGGPPILLLSCPGAAADLINQHSLGSTVEPSDIARIRQVILDIYYQATTGRPIRLSNVGIEKYDRLNLTFQFATLLSALGERKV